MPSARLTAKESLILWGGIIVVAFSFFMLGLWLGVHERAAQPPADLQASSRQPVPQSETRLGLAHPIEPTGEKPAMKSIDPTASKSAETARAGSIDTTKPARPLTIKVEPAPKDDVSKPAPAFSPRGAFFTIQLGALKTDAEARKLVADLKQHGYTGIIDPPSGRDTYYRVRVGGYETRDAAVRAEALLKNEGFSTFVKKIERRSAN